MVAEYKSEDETRGLEAAKRSLNRCTLKSPLSSPWWPTADVVSFGLDLLRRSGSPNAALVRCCDSINNGMG